MIHFALAVVAACATMTTDDFQKRISETGGEVVGGVVIDGKNSDLLLVYEVDGVVAMLPFKDGCALPLPPLGIDRVKPETGA